MKLIKIRKDHLAGRKSLWVETCHDQRAGKSRGVPRQTARIKKQGMRKGHPGESCSVTLGRSLCHLVMSSTYLEVPGMALCFS